MGLSVVGVCVCFILDEVRVIGLMGGEYGCYFVVVGWVDVFVNVVFG